MPLVPPCMYSWLCPCIVSVHNVTNTTSLFIIYSDALSTPHVFIPGCAPTLYQLIMWLTLLVCLYYHQMPLVPPWMYSWLCPCIVLVHYITYTTSLFIISSDAISTPCMYSWLRPCIVSVHNVTHTTSLLILYSDAISTPMYVFLVVPLHCISS